MINCTVSMFGDLGVGFTSYPNEKATNEVFQTFRDKVWAHSSLVTHRDGRKMYYAYLRQIVGKQYICFCVMLNDAYFTNLRELFTLFEEVFNDVQKQGVILGNDSKGRLIAKVKNLSSQQEEVDRITGYIRQRIEMVKDVEYPLPRIGELNKLSEDDIDNRRFEWDYMSDKVYKECLETDYIVISKDDASTGNAWLQAPVPILVLAFLMPVVVIASQIYFFFDESLRIMVEDELSKQENSFRINWLLYALGCLGGIFAFCSLYIAMGDGDNNGFRKWEHKNIPINFGEIFAFIWGIVFGAHIICAWVGELYYDVFSITVAFVVSGLSCAIYTLMIYFFVHIFFSFYRVSRRS